MLRVKATFKKIKKGLKALVSNVGAGAKEVTSNVSLASIRKNSRWNDDLKATRRRTSKIIHRFRRHASQYVPTRMTNLNNFPTTWFRE